VRRTWYRVPVICYLITRDGKPVYVGLTKRTLAARWKSHVSSAKRNEPQAMPRAINKYGPDAFAIQAVATARDYESLKALEVELIAQYGTMAPNGYNLTVGGEGRTGYVVSAETCQRISIGRMGKPSRNGQKNTPEHNAAAARANTGKVRSPELRAVLSAAMLAFYAREGVTLGRSPSKETREAISAKLVGRKPTAEALANQSKATRGKPKSDAHIAAITAAHVARFASLQAKHRAACFCIRAGATQACVAEWFAVSLGTVRNWCKKHLGGIR